MILYPSNIPLNHQQFCRTLSNGQRGEVYEINGDQVAVVFDSPGNKIDDDNTNKNAKEQPAKPSIYWVDSMLLFHTFIAFFLVWDFCQSLFPLV